MTHAPNPAFVRSFASHPLSCRCSQCSEEEKLREQHIVLAMPTGALPSTSVSVGELLGNSRVDYHVGEDWSDD